MFYKKILLTIFNNCIKSHKNKYQSIDQEEGGGGLSYRAFRNRRLTSCIGFLIYIKKTLSIKQKIKILVMQIFIHITSIFGFSKRNINKKIKRLFDFEYFLTNTINFQQ